MFFKFQSLGVDVHDGVGWCWRPEEQIPGVTRVVHNFEVSVVLGATVAHTVAKLVSHLIKGSTEE